MLDLHDVFGAGAVLAGVIATYSYFPGMLRGTFRPHAFSWLVWVFVNGIGFVAQVTAGAGAGSWSMGAATLACGLIFLYALLWGEKTFAPADWASISAALFAIFLWWLTKDPTWSVILVAVIDGCGYIPTFRKSFRRPHEESVMFFGMSALQFFLSIIALEFFSVATALLPIFSLVMNGSLTAMILLRRRAEHRAKA